MKRRMPPWLGWTLAVLVAAGFARLGFWQLARMHEKEALLASVDHVLAKRVPRPLSLAADPSRARAFDWAAGRGEFSDDLAYLLDNQTHRGSVGVRAYRTFESHGTLLLVDLGWIALPPDRTMPVVPKPEGQLELRGLLAPPPSSGLKRRKCVELDRTHFLLTCLDPATLMHERGGSAAIAPRVLRLDPAMAGIGYVRDLDVLPNTLPPSRHLGYAVQWFALAAAVLATAVVLTFRKPRA
jgi:cytochrome oxidase assembly protein ShyY1